MSTDGRHESMPSTTTISIPEHLADELYNRKKRGESYADVIQRLLDAEQAVDASVGGTDHREQENAERAETSPVSESLDETMDRIADESIRGSGSKHAARKEAFFAVVDYLREYGSATPDDLKREVYPNHRARHTDGDDPAHSWWKNSMYPPLRDLAEETSVVEKADQSGTWEWNANNE